MSHQCFPNTINDAQACDLFTIVLFDRSNSLNLNLNVDLNLKTKIHKKTFLKRKSATNSASELKQKQKKILKENKKCPSIEIFSI